MGNDLLRKLTEQVLLFIMPSNSNVFLTPSIRSILSWICLDFKFVSEFSNTKGTTSKAGTKAPLPTCKYLMVD